MDLIPNAVFHISASAESSAGYTPGLYRVISNDPRCDYIICVLIKPDLKSEAIKQTKGRKEKDKDKIQRRKKPPKRLVGKLLWLERAELQKLHEDGLLQTVEMERPNLPDLGKRSQQDYERRIKVMDAFLDLKELQESIVHHQGLSGLVAEAQRKHNVSRSFIYTQWSNLCRYGIDRRSLVPRRDLCGAPGVPRPCDPLPEGGHTRQKAGRKTVRQRVAEAFGETVPPDQPGMTTDWEKRIRAADSLIPTPKPSWRIRHALIINSAFVSRCTEKDGDIVFLPPEKNSFPNQRQVKRILQRNQSRIERLVERTTQRHFTMSRRGLNERAWQGIAGPGHTWAIDSTVGDIYLRSSVNRRWCVGRPIVYVVVDMWSTAVVGFYVCLTGPSWNTAKLSIFSSVADPRLVAGLWGYVPLLTLDPAPSLCYCLLCDRGEYLSQGQRQTAMKLKLQLTSYTPPYRGDLKGLVEVLHRIRKDEEFLFIPGAMDFRRKEMELRKSNPGAAAYTVREYVAALYMEFSEYNLSACREHRMDALMVADGVFPSPAGLWHWGHRVGIGYRHHVPESDLITSLLPSDTGVVARDGVRHAGCHYMSDEVKEKQWTTIARNVGSWKSPLNYFPGSMGSIWVPNHADKGLLRLRLSDEARVSAEATLEEWSDVLALQVMRRSDFDFERVARAGGIQQAKQALLASAQKKNAEAAKRDYGATPTMSEARLIEVAASAHASGSETKTAESLRDEMLLEHDALMAALLRSGNEEECRDR